PENLGKLKGPLESALEERVLDHLAVAGLAGPDRNVIVAEMWSSQSDLCDHVFALVRGNGGSLGCEQRHGHSTELSGDRRPARSTQDEGTYLPRVRPNKTAIAALVFPVELETSFQCQLQLAPAGARSLDSLRNLARAGDVAGSEPVGPRSVEASQ